MAVLNPDASTGSKILFSLVKLIGEEENLEAEKIFENRAHLGDKVNNRLWFYMKISLNENYKEHFRYIYM